MKQPSFELRTSRIWTAAASVVLALASLVLAACSSTPQRGAEQAGPAPAPTPAPAPARKPVVKKNGGGYYLDDGPGDDPPDLAAVPEPVPRNEPLRRAANKPYSVLGQSFEPFQTLRKYTSKGVGTWYGRKFHGQLTASGERYDMYGMSAAHPVLPIPSFARVTNLQNGKSVVVRINDRGPFLHGRLIDLSYAAAWKLGYAAQGSAPLSVESILPEDMPAATTLARPASDRTAPAGPLAAAPAPVAQTLASEPGDPIAQFAQSAREEPATVAAVTGVGGVFLQLASFSSRGNADSFKARLAAELADAGALLSVVSGAGRFRIHLGPYASAQEAVKAAGSLGPHLNLKPFLVR